MGVIWYFAVLFGLFAIHAALSRVDYIRRRPMLDEAHGGPTSTGIVMGRSRNGNVPPLGKWQKLKVDGQNIVLDRDKYKQFIVRGKCLEKRGIYDGDVVIAEMFGRDVDNEAKRGLIEKDNILVIWLDDSFKGHKLRVLARLDDDVARTYYFDGSRRKNSGKPHDLADVVGVVRHRLAA